MMYTLIYSMRRIGMVPHHSVQKQSYLIDMNVHIRRRRRPTKSPPDTIVQNLVPSCGSGELVAKSAKAMWHSLEDADADWYPSHKHDQ